MLEGDGEGWRGCWKEVVGGGGGRRWVVGMVVKRQICKMYRGILFIVNTCYHQIFFIKFSAFLLKFRFLSVF